MSSGFGQGPKKETVYSGPALGVKQAPAYNSMATASGGGTVYNGPTPGGTTYSGPARPAAPPVAQPPAAQTSTGATKGAGIFFVIAGFTAINMVLVFAGVRFAIGIGSTDATNQAAFVAGNAIAICIFILLGVFAKQGSKAAFIIGMLLYGADLVMLVMNPQLRIASIVVHGFFLFRLFQAFRELPA
jgi:hypothetical protein